MDKIVLGSSSPRRQELLKKIGIPSFEIRTPTVEEVFPENLSPQDTVAYISKEKSIAISSSEDEILITADTMVFLGNQKLGKPTSETEALQMLLALQGTNHIVCTGVTVRKGEKSITKTQTTKVFFRELSKEEALAYIHTGEPMDKAGAYGVQGKGSLLVDHIEGDFFNVMGLPLVTLAQILSDFGINLL